jgi:hypothetical protein
MGPPSQGWTPLQRSMSALGQTGTSPPSPKWASSSHTNGNSSSTVRRLASQSHTEFLWVTLSGTPRSGGLSIGTARYQLTSNYDEVAKGRVGSDIKARKSYIFADARIWKNRRMMQTTKRHLNLITIASVPFGASQGLWEFTAARVLQGIGGAMIVPSYHVPELNGGRTPAF